MRVTSFLFGSVLLGLIVIPTAAQDLKIRKKMTVKMPDELAAITRKAPGKDDSDSMETVIYFKRGRMRTEQITKEYNFIGMSKKRAEVEIRQCDKQRTLYLDSKKKSYSSVPFTDDEQPTTQSKGKTGGVVKITETFTDTGERKEMFGFSARRIKTTMTFKPGKGSCMEQMDGEMIIEKDGWYTDIEDFSCSGSGSVRPDFQMECEDRYEHEVVGKAETGFALWELTKMKMGAAPSMTILEEVISVERGAFPDSLFDAPTGTENVADVPEVEEQVGPPAGETAAGRNAQSSNLKNAPTEDAGWTGPSTEKRPGVIRIGIANVMTKTPSDKKDSTVSEEISASVRDTLIQLMNIGDVEALRLTSESPVEEAAEKDCDMVLYVNVTQKRGGGGLFGKMILGSVASVAGAAIPGTAGAVASTAGSIAVSESMSKNAKAKDEFSLEYRLEAGPGAPVTKGSSKAKAKQDGEDVLSPQIESASKAIVAKAKPPAQ